MDGIVETDVALLRRYFANGDAGAMAELVRRHAGVVFGAARRITGNREDAEDIAQGCFLELLRSGGKIAGAGDAASPSAAGWLHCAAVHRALDAIRNDRTRRRHEREAARLRADAAQTAQWWEQIAPQVDAAIEQLPAELREPLILHYLQGRSQAEVAQLTGVSQPTVSRRLEDAVGQLRRKLGQASMLSVAGAGLGPLLMQHALTEPPASLTTSLGKMAVAGVGACGMTMPAAATGAWNLSWIVKSAIALAILIAAGTIWMAVIAGLRQSTGSSAAPAGPAHLTTIRPVPSEEEKDLLNATLKLSVHDPVRCAGWWRDHLGFVIEKQDEGTALLRRDECRVEMHRGAAAAGGLHFATADREDVDDLYAEFLGRQVVIAVKPHIAGPGPGTYQMTVRDEEGHELTFLYSLERSKP
jgi:RNA polymerase sigma factor (sigma-70 family)